MDLSRRPFVFANLAITADGKIAPHTRHFIPFSSRRDQDFMMELRTRADAVMAGARTAGAPRVTLGPGGKTYQQKRLLNGLSEFNLRVITSPTCSISPRADIFKKRFSPVILFTTEAAPRNRLLALQKAADDLFVSPGSKLDLKAALAWLRDKWKVRRLLCEGGGELNGPMFRANLIDELYLTICPVIFGGRGAPTIADGDGIETLNSATRLKLKNSTRIGDELFCVYKVLHDRPN
jgi:riboflavin-specific deaminase-like protein